MKKFLLLSLSLVLMSGAGAIGVYGNSNENEKKSVVTSIVDSEFDYLETMDGFTGFQKREGVKYLVAIDVLNTEKESVFTYAVGHFDSNALAIDVSESVHIVGLESERAKKINRRIRQLTDFCNTEPLVSNDNFTSVSYGGRNMGKRAILKLHEHVLEFRDGSIGHQYFKKQ